MVASDRRVIVERRDDVMAGIITINRPDVLNAIDDPTAGEIYDAVGALDGDEGVRSVILTGSGNRAFCTGWDLGEASRITAVGDPDERAALQRRMDQLFEGLPTTKPVIAAINGYCIAGGVELALLCDLIVAAEDARFGLQEVRWGIMASVATQLLPRRIPRSLATEWILMGELVDAGAAFRAGLVNRLVPRDRVVDEALVMAGVLATRGPLAVRASKQAIVRGAEVSVAEGLELASRLSEGVIGSEDAHEGALAFLEKREARFVGR